MIRNHKLHELHKFNERGEELIFKEEVYAIVGAAMHVHQELGSGFLEAVYQEALEIEFTAQGISHIPQPQIHILYRNRQLKKYYEPDFLVYDKIVVEIKAMKSLGKIEQAQILNSIKCCNKELGVLINFGETSLKWKRYINSH